MNQSTRAFLGTGSRLVVVALLLTILVHFRALEAPTFFFTGLIAFFVGLVLSMRVRKFRLLVDTLITFASLFLLPPTLLALLASPLWISISIVLVLFFMVLAYLMQRTWYSPLIAGLWILSIVGSMALIDVLYTYHDQPSDKQWLGYPALLQDAGWDNAHPGKTVASFPPRYKYSNQPEPTQGGSPPANMVLGVLEKEGHLFSLRPFFHSRWLELSSASFKIEHCSPLLDVAYYRFRNRWVFLCGGSQELVFYKMRQTEIANALKLKALWPKQLVVHQELERLYIIDPASGYLTEFDLEVFETLRRIKLTYGVSDVVLDPEGQRLYVASPFTGKVICLDLTSLKTIARISVPFGLSSLAMDRANKQIFGATLPRGRLVSIDLKNNKVTVHDKLNSPVLDLAYDSASERLYWSTPRGLRWIQADKILSENVE